MHSYITQSIFITTHALYHTFSYIFMQTAHLRNIGPPAKIHNTRLRKRMENEERAESESPYQKELEAVRSDVARLTSLLEKALRARDGERTSTQTNDAPPATQSHVVPQVIGTNSPKKRPEPIRPIQIPITMDLTAEDPEDWRSSDQLGRDKWTALEERLRAVEGNDLSDPVRAAEACLVPKIVIP